MNPEEYHEPVLLNEALRYLVTDPDGLYIDATTGGGGHSSAVLAALGTGARLICLDADDEALRFASGRLRDARVSFIRANFRDLGSGIVPPAVSGILFDLGVSSHQIDAAERGFSFRAGAPVDMRMDRRLARSGWHVVNECEEQDLARIIADYGEERHARRIARSIVRGRPIDDTGALREAVTRAVGGPMLVKSLARVFQAIRMEVNDEPENLRRGLEGATALLRSGGRMVVISYHSLEDRLVKEFFRDNAAHTVRSVHPLIPDRMIIPRLRVLTRRPVTAGNEETRRNPRARSAKLRAAERLPESS